jgi:indole-3-glycerol phosphate synthase
MDGTILEKIVATKHVEVREAVAAHPVGTLKARIARNAPPRDFYSAIAGRAKRVALIAEIKKASPSAGLIRRDFDPVEIARVYAAHGAAGLSVLTDRRYFQGELGFLEKVKDAVELPVLRKDFIVDEYQIYESRAAGADAVLLIAAALDDGQIDAWSRLAYSLGMASLIEVHDADELGIVMPLISPQRRTILGINNRDLKVQRVDLDTTRRLAGLLPAGMPFVSESGIKTRDDIATVAQCGARAVLMGEVFMREADIGAKMGELGWGS